MNPLTQTLNQVKINEKELGMGLAGTKNSWHQEYKDSAWVFLGGLPYEMTEGDIICMFSQYGEPVRGNVYLLSQQYYCVSNSGPHKSDQRPQHRQE